MPDRSVTYTFLGRFSNLTAGLTTASRNVTDLGTRMVALDRNGQQMRAGLMQVGRAAGAMGLVAAAGVAVVVRASANFEQAMSNVQAATHETTENMDQLRQAALDFGQSTKFSATEAAGAIEELAKAGVSTQDILGGGLKGSLDLAAAGGLEVADAAQIAATALTQFNLAGEDVPHVADLLAAGAGKAQGDVSDLSMALKQSGLVAAQMGVSIEETTGTLAAFASAGLLGSDAGTSFRTMLLRLANPTGESAKLMKSLGIAAYDAQGNFVGIESLAGQLQTAFQGQSQATRDAALATIFGSDAIRAANVLYTDGAAGIADWTSKVNDQGYAAETASIKMDNLNGDLEQLRGALETAFIGAGGDSQGPLRSLVQDITGLVNAFNSLPGPAKSAATGLLAVTAVLGLGIWSGAKIIGGIAATKLALQQLGISATTTARAMTALKVAGGLAAGLTVAAVAIRAINEATRDTLPGVQSLTEGLLNLKSAGDVSALGDQFKDLGDDLARVFDKSFDESLGDKLFTPFKPILGNTRDTQEALDEIKALDEALANLVNTRGPQAAADALQSLADSGAITSSQLADLRKQLPQYDDALAGVRLSSDDAANSTGELSSTTEVLGDTASDAAQNIADLIKAMQDQKDAAVNAFNAETQYRQAMKDATKQANQNNAGIQGNSKAALANRDSLSELIGSWNSLDQTVTDNVGKFKQARENFIKTAEGMGVSKGAATKLWQEMAKIPSSKVIPVTVQTGQADAALRALKARMDAIKDKHVTVTVNSVRPQGGQAPTEEQVNNPPKRTQADGSGVGDRLRRAGVNTVAARAGDLKTQAEGKAALALQLLAKDSHDAGEGTKGLKARLAELEQKLNKAGKAADNAHDALDSLRDQKASLSSSVSQALTHDPFGGSLDTFSAQTAADEADAAAMLQALQTIVGNGIDPTSAFFQQLASSGNVALAQQFAALTRGQLASYAMSFAATQAALGAVGSFAGDAAFNDAIKAQVKVTQQLDSTVRHLAQQVNHLEKAIDHMGDRVEKGAHKGTKEGTKEGQDERRQFTGAGVRTGGGRGR